MYLTCPMTNEHLQCIIHDSLVMLNVSYFHCCSTDRLLFMRLIAATDDRRIGLDTLAARKVKSIQVSIAECPAQEAIFRSNIPDSEEELANLEQLLTTNYTVPKGCTATGAGSGSIGGGPGPQLERQSADSDGMQAPKTDDFFWYIIK